MNRRWLLLWVLAVGCGGGEVGLDAGPADAGADSGNDPVEDAGIDASHEDAGEDGGGLDGSADAASDAGADGSTDGGTDASIDGGPCVLDRTILAGDTTNYSIAGGTTCGGGIPPWMSARMAVSPSVYAGGTACGTCARVTGPVGSALVLIDDQCPDCAPDDIDLDAEAFAAITGASEGRYAVTWQRVPCEPTGNVQIDFQGSNPFYVKLRLTRQRNPIARVEIQRTGGAFAEAAPTIDGFFTLTPGEMLPDTLTIRATDTFGAVIEFSTPLNTTNGVLADTGEQLPVACAP